MPLFANDCTLIHYLICKLDSWPKLAVILLYHVFLSLLKINKEDDGDVDDDDYDDIHVYTLKAGHGTQ